MLKTRFISRSLIAAILPSFVAALSATAQVTVEPVELATPAGLARGFFATIFLADPRVELVVTPALPATVAHPENAEAMLIPTDEWAATGDVDLAINANYFGVIAARAADDDTSPNPTHSASYVKRDWSDIIGLSISNGTLVSPARLFRDQPDPVLLITRDGVARIETAPTPQDPSLYVVAVAGVGASDKESTGGLLVTAGANTGELARVGARQRHPRTAAAVSADGRTLMLAVIDGRQPGWSVGMTLPELADFLISKGAANAVNLDGGGSSSFVYFPDGRKPGETGSARRIVNRPSDGSFRPVANHLGVRIARRPAVQAGVPDGVDGVVSPPRRP